MHEAELDLPEAHSPEVRREVRGPQPLALYLLLEGADHLQELLVVEIEHLEREDLVAQKRPHPLELRLELRFS